MVTQNILGMLILLSNAAGVGYLIFLGGQAVYDHFFPKEPEPEEEISYKREAFYIGDDAIPDDDDLLKDMDLSDLDNLDLDDFE